MLAGHRRDVSVQRLFRFAYLSRQANNRASGLELREGRLEYLTRPWPAEHIDQVDGHVVGRTEAGVQRVCAPRSKSADRLRVHALRPLHYGVTFDFDAAAP